MGQAFTLLAADLQNLDGANRMLPPQVILVSDGKPTDDWRGGLQALFSTSWGQRAIRQAIAIGQDADQETLRKFIDNSERPVIRADNAEQLVRYFRYVSTSVATAAPGKEMPKPEAPPTGQLFDDSAW
jgi:uncharacterized protein YegL